MNGAQYHAERMNVEPDSYGFKEFGGSIEESPTCQIVCEMLRHVSVETIADFGAGAGRFSRFLAGLCKSLICVDAAHGMVRRIASLNLPKVSYVVTDQSEVFRYACWTADCIFTFDTMVHFHPEMFWDYIRRFITIAPNHILLHHGCGKGISPHGWWHFYPEEAVNVTFSVHGYKLSNEYRLPGGYGSRVVLFERTT